MNGLANFSGFALTRAEMKNVKGGQCYIRDGSQVYPCNDLQDCKSAVANGWGQNYCCSGCSSASWCQNGQCPQ
jgi:hypothetical protein